MYTQAERERPEPAVETPARAYDHDPVTAPIPVFDVEESVLPKSVPPWEYESFEDDAEPADVYDLVRSPARRGRARTRQPAAPVATAAVTEPPQDYDYRWVERDDDVAEVDGVVAPPSPTLRARPAPETAYVRPELDFAKSGYGTRQWYRTKPAAAVLAAALIAAVVCGGWLVFRSPGTDCPGIADEHADERRARAEQCRADCGERPQTQTGSPATSTSAASTIG